MLNCRKKAVEKINKMYGLNIEVSLNSVWETNQAELESETTLADMKNGADSITQKPVTNEKSADTDIEEQTISDVSDTEKTDTEKADTGTEKPDTEKPDTEKTDTEKTDTEKSDNEMSDDKKEKGEK